jgi:thiol-disulfide isomerase/thioredoxin
MRKNFLCLKFFSLILVFIVLTITQANAQEVKFKTPETQKDWQEAINDAKKTGKDIFLDIYATWCGPCKAMDANVYTDSAVAEFYNSYYINLKVDGEGEFGKIIATRYKLSAYPSLYYINADEKLIHELVGYRDPEAFINAGKIVKDFGKRYIELDTLYNSLTLNDLQTDEFMDILSILGKKDVLSILAGIKIKNYSEADILDPANKSVVMAVVSEMDSFPVYTVMKNSLPLKTLWGQEDFNQYLSEAFDLTMQKAVESRDSVLMEKIAGKFVPVYMMDNPDRIPEATLTTRKIYFSQTEDWENYIKSVEKHYNDFENGNLRFLYQETYYIIENQLFNSKLLNKSLEWIEKVITIQPDFDSYFLAAVVNTYRDDKEAAQLWMNKAESVAVSDDEKASLEELKKYLETL